MKSSLLRTTAVAALALGAVALAPSLNAAEASHIIPAPTQDEQAAPGATSEIAVLAGGCFWGVQGVFQHVKGVTNAVSGYAGGQKQTAIYEVVSTGATGHAESVQVTFDPRVISYGRILQIYFSVAHNPTELNRQGPDEGTQYRSAIFPLTPEQAQVAKTYINQLNQARVFDAAIVTKIEPNKTFYPAEGYHQNYLTLHPTQGYIAYNDLPKIGELKRVFPTQYRDDPVLVASAK